MSLELVGEVNITLMCYNLNQMKYKKDKLSQLLDPELKPDYDFEDYVEVASAVVRNKDIYQKVLGKVAASVSGKWGDKIMTKLSQAIQKKTGVKVSPSSLRNYRWVYQRLSHIMAQFPQDWSFGCWQLLARTEDPDKWLDYGLEHNLNSLQMTKEIYKVL